MDEERFKQELMAAFRAELEEHLSALDRGLLAVEQGLAKEQAPPVLNELFRAAHSIKGAASAVGLGDMGAVAHGMEDVLALVRHGDLAPTPDLLDPLFAAVDVLREAMAAYLRGESLAEQQRDDILARLQAAGTPKGRGRKRGAAGGRETKDPAPRGDGVGGKTPEAVAEAEAPGAADGPGAAATASSASRGLQADTIRMSTAKLDALMAGVGQLLVARMRLEQRLAELRAFEQRLSDWEKTRRRAGARHAPPGAGPGLRRPFDYARGGQDSARLRGQAARSDEGFKSISGELHGLVRRFVGDHNYLSLLTEDLQDGLRRVRMLRIATLFDQFPRMVRDLARQRDKDVVLQVEGAETEVDRQVLESLKDPLTHLLRNAVDHGIEPAEQREAAGKPRRGVIRLRAVQKGATVVLEVADDGGGIDVEAVRRAVVERGLLTQQGVDRLGQRETLDLIFRSGFSTTTEVTDVSGRGVGLDVVRENLEQVRGMVVAETAPGQGTTFTLTLPLAVATNHVLLVEAAGQTVAVPTTNVIRILRTNGDSVGSIEGKQATRTDAGPLPLVALDRALGFPAAETSPAADRKAPVVVLGVAEKRVAFQVDRLLGAQSLVVKGLGPQLKRVRNVAGASILGSGQVVMILNVVDLVRSAQGRPAAAPPRPSPAPAAVRQRVLVVDDSITTRVLEKNILQNAGYEVLVAADGVEAYALARSERLDAIVSDVDMPRMDGFSLTEKIRADKRARELPVVLVTALHSQEHRIRAVEAGADAFITKGAFDQDELLATIERLIG